MAEVELAEQPGARERVAQAGRTARWILRHLPELLIGLAALPSLVRLVGDHSRAWPIMIVAFAPVAAMALVPLGVLAAALHRRWAAAVALGLVVLNVVWLVPLWTAADGPDRDRPFGVATVNLQYGWADAAQVVDQVKRWDVDVLATTELTPESAAELRAAGIEKHLPHHVLAPDASAHGSGLWSRHPLTALPEWDGVHRMPGATARVEDRDVVVRVVHPFRTGRFSAASYRADYATLEKETARIDPDTPALLLGDFNATRDHGAFRKLLGDRWRDASEFAGSGLVPTWSPRYWIHPLIQLDHVLMSRHFGASEVSTFDLTGSDHQGVVADLWLAPEEPAGP